MFFMNGAFMFQNKADLRDVTRRSESNVFKYLRGRIGHTDKPLSDPLSGDDFLLDGPDLVILFSHSAGKPSNHPEGAYHTSCMD
jgi:hypothetical protein